MSTIQSALEANYEKRFDLPLWMKLLRYGLRRKGLLIALIASGFLTAVCDVLFPLLTKHVIDGIKPGSLKLDYWYYGALYAGLSIALAASILGFIMFAGRIRTHIAHDIRQDGFEKLQQLSFSYFDKHPVGWLMSRMTSDCERLSNIMAWGTLDLVWGGTLIVGISVAMLLMRPDLAVLVLLVLPVLAVSSAWFQKRILGSAREVRKTNSRITASFNEAIVGLRTTKVFCREQENLGEFQELTGRMHDVSVRNAVQSALFFPLVLTIGSAATGVALAYGGFQALDGLITIGTLMAFLAYTKRFFDPIEDLSHWFAELQMAQASAERIFGLIDTVPEIEDRSSAGADGTGEAQLKRIHFENVSFSYDAVHPVLEDFELEVRAGETVALVGPTGGGKSTIISLLCRFYEPTEGRILIDGVDYREMSLRGLQARLGIVLQEPHLFRGNIRENIRYGNLQATDAEVERAARTVGADSFLEDLADGYDTEVGEGGSLLSTGQKQLVSFARAILGNPQILVMDEATSSIDTETERRIQQGVEQVLAGRTSFVIAHRLSTIKSADRILVIEQGKIRESGTHQELLAMRGAYHALYTEQRLQDLRFG